MKVLTKKTQSFTLNNNPRLRTENDSFNHFTLDTESSTKSLPRSAFTKLRNLVTVSPHYHTSHNDLLHKLSHPAHPFKSFANSPTNLNFEKPGSSQMNFYITPRGPGTKRQPSAGFPEVGVRMRTSYNKTKKNSSMSITGIGSMHDKQKVPISHFTFTNKEPTTLETDTTFSDLKVFFKTNKNLSMCCVLLLK